MDLNPTEIKRLLHELHEFKKTFLYSHFQNQFRFLYDLTVDQIIEERLKGPETLYTRESWIGEARAVKTQAKWFEELEQGLQIRLREIEP